MSLVQLIVPTEVAHDTIAELVALVHLNEPRLMLLQLRVQLVHRLRGTRADRQERRRVVQRADLDLLLLFLGLSLEETHSASHLVDSADLAHERALERIDIRVELVWLSVCCRGTEKETSHL